MPAIREPRMRNGFMSASSATARAVVASLLAMALPNASSAATASCQQAAQHLVTLVKQSWPSSDQGTQGATGDMIGLITRQTPAGVVTGATRFKLTYSHQKFTALAEQMKPPFTPSGELLTALDELDAEIAVVALPGTRMFAANSTGGTAHCNSTVFFSTAKRHAHPVEGPESWKDDGGASCGVTRSFISIDGTPFVIDDSLSAGPGLASTLTLTPWANGKWLQPCRAEFVFAPHFDTKGLLNDWAGLNGWAKNDCGAGGCDAFQRAAFTLVQQTQQDRAGVESHLLAAMTSAQRGEYQLIKRLADKPEPDDSHAGGDAGKPATTAGLTDTMPLVLPVVVDNHVYLATVGHFTIGWRLFADWKVTFEAGEADKTREIARFAIAMTPGPIISTVVK
jgi:hypothetical protein